MPPAIIGVGLNYKKHAEEMNMSNRLPKYPPVFFKNPASVLNPFDAIVIPKMPDDESGSAETKNMEVDYEAELGYAKPTRDLFLNRQTVSISITITTTTTKSSFSLFFFHKFCTQCS